MGKVEMVNVSNNHFTLGGITFVEEERISELEKSGFELLNKKEEKPDMSWTELKLKSWIDKNYPEIKYEPKNNTKKELFEKLKKMGLI